MYESFPVGPFSGGLNIRDFPDQIEPTQAYDLNNVTFTDRGGVKSRPGYSNFKTSLTNTPDWVEAYSTGSDWQIAVSAPGATAAGNRIEVYDSTGTAVGTALTSGISASPNFFTRFGGRTTALATPYLYATNGTDQMRKWTGAGSWSTPSWNFTNSAPNPTGMFGAVSPWDSRFVLARFPNAGGGDNPSSVRFSAVSDPETWDGYEYVDLTPGDGEKIMGMATYGNYVIVFKESKFFVFYGTTYNASNSLGVPEFEFRTIDTGIGLSAKQCLCVAPDGVYFMNNKGLYKTDGGPPVLVSALIEPLWSGDIPTFYNGGAINFSSIDKARLAFHRQQVYLAVPTNTSATNNTVLVHDPRYGWWSVWSMNVGALVSFEFTKANPKILFALSSGDKNLCKLDPSLSTDAGTGISARIKMGFNDLGVPVAKTLRETQLWGTGSIRFATAKDISGSSNESVVNFEQSGAVWSDGTNASDTWGDGTGTDLWSGGEAADFQLSRRSLRGQVFSVEIYSSTAVPPGPWSVYKAIYRVRDQRVASVTKIDR